MYLLYKTNFEKMQNESIMLNSQRQRAEAQPSWLSFIYNKGKFLIVLVWPITSRTKYYFKETMKLRQNGKFLTIGLNLKIDSFR